jgi:hypothetical protein
MGISDYDPTARQITHDVVDVSDLRWSSSGSGSGSGTGGTKLDAVVERLTDLQAKGYTGFDVEAYEEQYGGTEVTLKVTRERLENDEEYEVRMKRTEFFKKREYQHFLELKAKFEDPAKAF